MEHTAATDRNFSEVRPFLTYEPELRHPTPSAGPSLSITAIGRSNRPNSCEDGTLIRGPGKTNQI